MKVATRQLLSLLFAAFAVSRTATAQNPADAPYYQPLNDRLPPGYNAEILERVRRDDAHWLQPVRVEVPTTAQVSAYSAAPEPLLTGDAPAQFSVSTGHLYRLRLAEMPEFPGLELFPSIEILDRLHPPEGLKESYPIPIVFDEADLRAAAEGLLVTRVIYLERPQIAASGDPLRSERAQTVAPGGNAIDLAARHGRPMVIVRIGGRVPSGPDSPPLFFGTGGPLVAGEPVANDAGVARIPRRQAGPVASFP